ncbi:hypothetical protein CRG98_036630 [Punica granatum]|uniref:Uncharacterized protein n=1 Tax=Punica granatum TaxID=22663 RepID=A0A2I0IFS5_PUNGR|nr:hypothetical protein CRG98_036630 [Punica granatum]
MGLKRAPKKPTTRLQSKPRCFDSGHEEPLFLASKEGEGKKMKDDRTEGACSGGGCGARREVSRRSGQEESLSGRRRPWFRLGVVEGEGRVGADLAKSKERVGSGR